MTTKTMSIISLVCGIVGMVGGFLTSIPVIGWLVPLCPIAGIVFGAIALKKIKEEGVTDGKGLAVAGLVLGIVALAIDVITLIACTICVAAFGSALSDPNVLNSLANI